MKKALRHYEYQCNGYAIRHVSERCIYTIEHPVTDERYGFEHTLKEARKFAKSLPELYPIRNEDDNRQTDYLHKQMQVCN